MPRYFFDVHDGALHLDKEGQECASLEEVRHEAMGVLPAIAKDKIPADGDKQAFTVMARDDGGRVVYTATITFAGLWMYADPG